MIISTFKFWYIAAPATLLGNVVLARVSVTERNYAAISRGSDTLWKIVSNIYAIVAAIGLFVLLIHESLLDLGIEDKTVVECLFALGAIVWSFIGNLLFSEVRNSRFARIDYDCCHGRSKADIARRRRALRDEKIKRDLAEKRRKRVASHDYDWSEVDLSEAQQNTIDYRARAKFGRYKIEKRDDLNLKIEEGKTVSDILPMGVYEYFVAVNTKDEDAEPIYVGWKNPEDNLQRYLIEIETEQVKGTPPRRTNKKNKARR